MVYELKVRHLYNGTVTTLISEIFYAPNECIKHDYGYYVVCDYRKLQNHPCVTHKIEPTGKFIYVTYVTYENGGKVYAYWTDKTYKEDSKVLIRSVYSGDIFVTVIETNENADTYEHTKATKFLPVLKAEDVRPKWGESALTKVQTNVETLSENFEKLKEGFYDNAIKPLIYGKRRNEIHYCNEEEYNNILNNEKENETMNFMKNFEFGKINTSALKMSMCGLAFQRTDKTYATYNVEDNSFTEVTDFLMDMDCVFVMPVAAKDIKAGDIVKHLNTYVVVKSINEDGSISAISPIKAEEICIIPTKNLFGFNYYSKVMNFFDGMMKPTDENPFGNPMMLMMLFGDKMDFNGDMKSMLPLFLLNNQNGDMKDLMSNPLFFLALTK